MVKKPKLSTLTPEEYEKRLKKIILAGLGKAWMFWPVRAEAKRRCKDPNRPGWSSKQREARHRSHRALHKPD